MNRLGQSGATGWRFFPWYVAGGIGLTMLVNAALVCFAVHSFPGLATTGGFAASNAYDRVLAAAAEQNALGWSVQASLPDGRPLLTLATSDGTPIAGATVAATAERPIGNAAPIPLAFHETSPGRQEADTTLAPGKWAVDFTVTGAGHTYHTIRRFTVPGSRGAAPDPASRGARPSGDGAAPAPRQGP